MFKLVKSNYDKEDGISFVEIQTDYGNFCDYSFLNPEDKDVASSFLGCELAEYRATIQYFEKCLVRVNIQINCLEDLKTRLGHEEPTLEKRLKQYKDYKKEITDNIKSLKEVINNKLENRLVIIDHMKKIKEKKTEE